jgi:DNA-directed RNA polymerase specialized sigma24 family protein
MEIIDDVQQQQQYWENLVQRIAAGDPGGEQEFRATYRMGIRFLLQRRIGDPNLEEVVEDTVMGILQEISQGRMTTVAEMARFIRKAIPSDRPAASGPVLTEAARDREQTRVKALDEALQRFNSTEREALICYYARGFSERDVEAEFGYEPVAFHHLRERLVRSLNSTRARRGPKAARRAALMRTAGSGAA